MRILLSHLKPSNYLWISSALTCVLSVVLFLIVFQLRDNLSSDSRFINKAGVVRGIIQHVTLNISLDNNIEKTEHLKKVDLALNGLKGERAEWGQRDLLDEFDRSLKQLEEDWALLKQALLQQHSSQEAKKLLGLKAELCWKEANKLVLEAEAFSEKKASRLQIMLDSVLWLIVITALLSIWMTWYFVRHRLERESVVDELTGIANRRGYDQAIKDEISRASRYSSPLSILVCDIDFFKKVNDQHGHSVGDSVLTSLAKLLIRNIRKTDQVFRFGGEEFVILCPQINESGALSLAESIRKAVVLHPFITGDPLSVSIGVAQYKPEQSEAEFFESADKALYHAKKSGRNRSIRASQLSENVPSD